MRRNVSPFEQWDRDDNHLVMSASAAETQVAETPPTADIFDDIFGSSPPSPTTELQGESALPPGVPTSDPSDIPRLRRIHVTNGYRNGIAASKEKHIQQGFDQGYNLGAEIGLQAGWCLGALEGIYQAISSRGQNNTLRVTSAMSLSELSSKITQAQAELTVDRLLGSEHFNPDGVWVYYVPDVLEDGRSLREDQVSVSFAQVAAWHPSIKKWREATVQLAGEVGLVLR